MEQPLGGVSGSTRPTGAKSGDTMGGRDIDNMDGIKFGFIHAKEKARLGEDNFSQSEIDLCEFSP